MVFERFVQKQLLQLFEPVGVLRRQIVRRTEVVIDVIQLPLVFEQRATWLHFPRSAMRRMSQPGIVIDAAIAEDFKVLRLVSVLRFGVVKRVKHAHSLNGSLQRAVHDFGFGQSRRFENRRSDVDDVMPLRSNFPLGFDAVRPVSHESIASSAVTASDLLRPSEWRVPSHGPSGGVVAVRIRATQVIQMLEYVCDRFGHTVEVSCFIEQPVHRPFGTRAVVTDDVEDECVVQLPQVFDRIDHATHLGVGVLTKSGEDFHLACKQFLLVGAELVPILDPFRLQRELRSGGDDSQFDLSSQRLFSQLVSALIELPFVLGDPLLRHMMWRVSGSRCKVREERLLGSECFGEPDPLDRLIGEVGHEMVLRVGSSSLAMTRRQVLFASGRDHFSGCVNSNRILAIAPVNGNDPCDL